ncbi:hypothetical protein Mame01_36250 [Microbispora amethystogenes]|nr:hypothetical protein Mame01_36250 [Microbispora amethystogenes]
MFTEDSAVEAVGASPAYGVNAVTGGSGGMAVESGGGAVTVPVTAPAGRAPKPVRETVSAALPSVTQAARSRVVGLADRGISPRVFRLRLPG